MLPQVFDLFAQETQALDRAQGGVGLGLAIVKNLLSLHGGRVEARSEGHGRGSEFLVELPAAQLAVPETARGAAASLPADEADVARRTRILVVDDNVDAAELLVESLSLFGYAVAVAHDGPSALALVDELDPKIVLLDIGLPLMNGYEVARRLRETKALDAIRLIAVTGYGQDADRRNTQASGFDAHLVKPIDLQQLRTLVRNMATS